VDLVGDRLWPTEVGAAADSILKRAFDLMVGGLLLFVLTPTLLLIAAAIYVESGGPVFFRQERGGLGGRTFSIWKFRTMLPTDGFGGWTQRDDKRVTPLGAFLRRTSLDELPQLFNVMAGEMSLVGPRPHASAMDAEYGAAIGEYQLRMRVRPGITGLAQISDLRGSVDGVEAMRQRVRADVDYIDTWSIGLDLKILAKTIPHLLGSSNAY
jgi:putative colanic acid biosynthesis UDP-glucose lipid carrier transferase